MAEKHTPILRLVQWLSLLAVACSLGADQGAFTTVAAEIVGDNGVGVSGVITPGETYNVKVTRRPSSDREVPPSVEQFVPVGTTSVRLPTASLYDAEGTARSLRMVAWFDPKYFSIESGREAIVDQGDDAYLWETTQFGKRSSERLKLAARRTAPVGYTDISFLLFAEGEQLADLVMPVYVAPKVPAGRLRTGRTVSPLRRPVLQETSDDRDFKGAVLTLIELHPRLVQAVFVENERYVTWTISLPTRLSSWAEAAGSQLNKNYVEPGTVAADVQDSLFPENERCQSANCANARKLFGAWIRRTIALGSDLRPPLVVQVLPTGMDALYSPVTAPLGMYPLPGSDDDAETTAIAADPVQANLESSETGTNVVSDDATAPDKTIAADPIETNHAASAEEIYDRSAQSYSLATKSATDSASGPAADPIGDSEGLKKFPYLGHALSIYVPVYRRRTAESKTACVDTWSIYIPPLYKDRENALIRARGELEAFVPGWRAASNDNRERIAFSENLDGLKQKAVPLKAGLLVVSHFDRGTETEPHPVLRLEHKDRVYDETVGVAQLRQEFRRPAVAVLLACETGMPAENAFVAKLIDHGAAALVTTTSKIEGKVAGQFAYRFVETLRKNTSAGGETVGKVFHDALLALPAEAKYMIPNFALLGDPEIRVCAPYIKE